MTLLFAVVVILVIAGAFLYASGRWSGLPDPERDRRPVTESGPEFDVVLRGYRMDEVDARIAALEQENAALRAKAPGNGR